uniref:Lipocalin/cytosolic fatty-acid binding domain-containing protein n=1 Tax=Leptobrachium leishanense TaxID=445787 RepID=A0A8C5QUV7_9ANUR
MKGLTLALGLLVALCTLCAQAKPVIKPDINTDEITGKWFCLAVASESPEETSESYTVFTSEFTFTADGKLKVETTIPRNGSCEKETKTYSKTDTPGRYIIYDSEIEPGVEVLGKDDSEDIVITAQPVFGWDPSGSSLYPLGRTQDVPAVTYEEFNEMAEDMGMDVADAYLLPKTGLCIL